MKKIKLLLNGLLVSTILILASSKVFSMPPALQDDIKHAMQKGDFRQGVQLGMMAGSLTSLCLMAKEGVVLPGEGPLTVNYLNDMSSQLLAKVRSEFDDYLFPYQKVGLNMGIVECNKLLGLQLHYR